MPSVAIPVIVAPVVARRSSNGSVVFADGVVSGAAATGVPIWCPWCCVAVHVLMISGSFPVVCAVSCPSGSCVTVTVTVCGVSLYVHPLVGVPTSSRMKL